MLGNQISMVVPLFPFITSSPECSLIILLTIGSPKPVPFFLVVNYGVITFFVSEIPSPLSFIIETI